MPARRSRWSRTLAPRTTTSCSITAPPKPANPIFDARKPVMNRTGLVAALLAMTASMVLAGSSAAQDLGPRVRKLADGVYVHTGKGFDSNSGIIITDEGVIVVDTGQNPVESRDIMDTVKKLTTLPVRLVIDTEPHADHTTGHFVFPQAIVIAAEGG